MTFKSFEDIDKALQEDGVQKVLAQYGRCRIAPGFTVADYVKIGEFYSTAGEEPSQGRRSPNLEAANA